MYIRMYVWSSVWLECGSLIAPILYQFVVPMRCKSNSPVHTLTDHQSLLIQTQCLLRGPAWMLATYIHS